MDAIVRCRIRCHADAASDAATASIPVFPLPNVVLFPNVFLPLHIFEPRYRQMVDDALTGDRIIGMVLLRPGWEADYEGRPPVYPIGCAGVITHAERLARRPLQHRPARHGEVPDPRRGRRPALSHGAGRAGARAAGRRRDRDEMRGERRRLEALLVPQPEGQRRDPQVPSSMADEDLVNALAQYLEFEPVEKQALLERDGLLDRCRSLIELLEMKVLVARHSWERDGIH